MSQSSAANDHVDFTTKQALNLNLVNGH